MAYTPLEQRAVDFIHALQHRKSAEDILSFYHPDVLQTEFPNTLTKNGTVNNLQQLIEGSMRGLKVLQKERYDIQKVYSSGDTVIMEVTWTGTLAIPLGNIQPGGEMKAHFAQFYEFRDGKIFRQRNYDCFEPFQ